MSESRADAVKRIIDERTFQAKEDSTRAEDRAKWLKEQEAKTDAFFAGGFITLSGGHRVSHYLASQLGYDEQAIMPGSYAITRSPHT